MIDAGPVGMLLRISVSSNSVHVVTLAPLLPSITSASSRKVVQLK